MTISQRLLTVTILSTLLASGCGGSGLGRAAAIKTVAGDGRFGFGGDGGPATAALLRNPHAVALDAAGNLFIADFNNHRIRRVDALTGVITTVAGDGTRGFSGDGGAATAAQMGRPAGVALDAAGNLFIADFHNHCIRRVDAETGVITTVAGDGTKAFGGDGGAATSAHLASPYDVVLDAAGNLFISDFHNHCIRRVNAQTGVIETVAGNRAFGFGGDGGAATLAVLRNPHGIALDAAANLFIADPGNHCIRRVNAQTGVISSVAGDGSLGFAGDGGAATAAQLEDPRGVALDAAGNLFISDNDNNRIRRVDSLTGVISTVAGAGTKAPLNRPIGVTLDAAGNLFIADFNNNCIRRINNLSPLDIVTTSLAAAPRNAFYKQKISASGGAGSDYDWRVATGTLPEGMELIDGTPTAILSGIPAVAGAFSFTVLVTDPNGNADTQAFQIVVDDLVIETVAGNGAFGFSGDGEAATAAQLTRPQSVAVDPTGNLFIAVNHRIRRVDALTGEITTVAGDGTQGFSSDGGAATEASLLLVKGVALDAAGNLFIAEAQSQRIRRVDALTGVISTVAGDGTAGFSGDGGAATAAQLNFPSGVAVDAAGNLFIADFNNTRIRRVDALTGVISTVAGNGAFGFNGDGIAATTATLSFVEDVAVDAAGNIFIAGGFQNTRIRRVDALTGVISTVAGNGTQGFSGDGGAATAAQLNLPSGVAVDAAGNLFIADSFTRRIRRVDALTGVISTVAGDGTAGFSGDSEAATAAQLNFPSGVAVDAAGNLFIADTNNNRIRRVSVAGTQ